MLCVNITKPGDPGVLKIGKTDIPKPQAGEVLIKVAAAGVNRPDIFQRMGLYPPPKGASPIPGLEVAGEITAVGSELDRDRIGQRVCALTNGGGYAEYVVVPTGQCLPVPAGLSLEEAAALPETCFTVWSNVFDRAGLLPGETFLVHGGSSGIGTTAIQMARVMGARVFTTAGSMEKCRACEDLGAEIAVNYREADFVKVLKQAKTAGMDVILDMVGGDYLARNIDIAAMGGRIVNIAYLKGADVTLNFLPVMTKRLTLTGSTLRPRSEQAKAAIARALKKNIWPEIEKGRFRPILYKTFPLSVVSAAHELMESSRHIGKIVLLTA